MPIIKPQGARKGASYYLVSLDRRGVELDDDDGEPQVGRRPYRVGPIRRSLRRASDAAFADSSTRAEDVVKQSHRERCLLSDAIAREIRSARTANRPYSDIFFIAHGWMADLGGAIDTFSAWVEQMEKAIPPSLAGAAAFRPLVVGVHWPSRPLPVRTQRKDHPLPHGLEPTAPGGPLDLDTETKPTFTNVAYSVVPILSFFQMEARAGVVGREGAAKILAKLQDAAGEAPDGTQGGSAPRFHLMGHSFGAKLLSETLRDPRPRHPANVRSVHTLFLVEAAFSTWGFDPKPNAYKDPAGPFSTVLDPRRKVDGAAIAVTSKYDYALGRVFPGAERLEYMAKHFWRGSAWRGWDTLPQSAPRAGALGFWSFSGVNSCQDTIRKAPAVPQQYGFLAKQNYHLVGDAVIDTSDSVMGRNTVKNDNFFVGGHSNIVHPEVANAFWQAALVP
ncbi:hypothetical protein ACFRFH_02975 [Leifsonia sp. NPDC056824]|uniref:hypothetical protein n=1 Tax=Leifsonia sp. NPDC056824 TaxID=3345953 RepID=UPI003676161F